MASVGAFVRLSRPHFLLGGFLMFGLGAAAANGLVAAGYLLGQATVTCAQVTAHYVNEYADVEPDRAVQNRTLFSGGSGMLVSSLAPAVALRAAHIATVLAVVLAAALATISPAAALLGMIALGVSWAYSMPPIRLLGTGWGELATSIVVVALVPLIGSLSQRGPLTADLAWSIAVLLPLHVAMMLAFQVPDLATDAEAGKMVLAVRVGRRRTDQTIAILLLLAALVALVGAAAVEEPGVALGPLGVLVPSAVVISYALRGDRYRLLTLAAVVALTGVGAALLVAVA